jgi:hypothetical protein
MHPPWVDLCLITSPWHTTLIIHGRTLLSYTRLHKTVACSQHALPPRRLNFPTQRPTVTTLSPLWAMATPRVWPGWRAVASGAAVASPSTPDTLPHPMIRVPQVPLPAPRALVGHHRLATGAEPPPGGPGAVFVAVGDLAHALPAPDLALAAHGVT